jgi:hypothetical protein
MTKSKTEQLFIQDITQNVKAHRVGKMYSFMTLLPLVYK